jgi:integration host factor subunit beta
MIKSELIEKLAAENTHLTHAEVERVVNIVLGRMVDSLGDGGRVELRGFGAFSVRGRPARAGRNPRTGEIVQRPATRSARFQIGEALKSALNG